MKRFILAILFMILASSDVLANESDASEKSIYLSLRLPSLDFGVTAAIGTPIGKSNIIGVSYYTGGLPMAGGGHNSALFLRSFMFNSSFYIEGRAGAMQTTWGHSDARTEAGPSCGFHIGNQYFYKSGFFQGVQWLGYDAYIEKGKGSGLPHFPAYELGFRF